MLGKNNISMHKYRIIKKVLTEHYLISKLGLNFRNKIKIFVYCSISFFNCSNGLECKLKFNNKRFGLKFTGNYDEIKIFFEIFIKQEYKIHKKNFNPKTILDLGGNTGYAAIYFACMFPDSRITTFEPSPDTFVSLKKNILSFNNINPVNRALSENTGEIIFYQDNNRNISSSVMNRGENFIKTKVQSISENDIFAKYILNEIDILKFDIEGSELYLFEKCLLIKKTTVCIGELHTDLIGMKEVDNIKNYLKNNFGTYSEIYDRSTRTVFYAEK